MLFVCVSLVIGLVSLGPAFLRAHRDPIPLVLFVCGLGTLLLTRALDAAAAVERCIVPVCACCLIAAHLRNHRACSRCHVCEEKAASAAVPLNAKDGS